MGQHKYNPLAQQVKEGLIEPKKKGLSKREQERRIKKIIADKTGLTSMLDMLHRYHSGI